MAISQNGWPVHTSTSGLVSLTWITGRVAPDPVAGLFDHLCRRFNAEVEAIRTDWSWGWNYRPIRGQSSEFSNHASGTGIDLNAPRHPLGKVGTFSTKQRTEIHRILADFDGAIRWGGDYSGRKDEMHFEINASAAKCRAVLAKLLTQEADMPYTDWPKKDRDALARDVANAVLHTKVVNPTASGKKLKLITLKRWFRQQRKTLKQINQKLDEK